LAPSNPPQLRDGLWGRVTRTLPPLQG